MSTVDYLACKHKVVDGYTQICAKCHTNIYTTRAEYLSKGDPLKQKLIENEEAIKKEMEERDKGWNTDCW